jgi:hypothetical protein
MLVQEGRFLMSLQVIHSKICPGLFHQPRVILSHRTFNSHLTPVSILAFERNHF